MECKHPNLLKMWRECTRRGHSLCLLLTIFFEIAFKSKTKFKKKVGQLAELFPISELRPSRGTQVYQSYMYWKPTNQLGLRRCHLCAFSLLIDVQNVPVSLQDAAASFLLVVLRTPRDYETTSTRGELQHSGVTVLMVVCSRVRPSERYSP